MKKKSKIIIGAVLSISLLGNFVTKVNNQTQLKKRNDSIAMYLENEDGGYDLSSQNRFPTEGYVLNTEKSICKNGGTLTQDSTTKKLSLSVSNSDQCTVYFDKEKKLTAQEILTHLNQISNGVRSNFDDPATTDEGVFEMEDDYGTSYYYRGAVEDNYVKYGVNKSGQEMWWRIIRINGDGSVRMVYDGTQGYANGTNGSARYIKTSQPFNAQYNDAKYVGWMYGPANEVEGTITPSTSKEEAQSNVEDSDIKKVVDAWYKENIEDTGYGVNVSDEIFCNDRSTPGNEITGVNSDTGLGYGTNVTYYGAYARMKISVNGYIGASPSFECPEKNDAFTVSDTKKGNGALTYPVGLITADEIVAAGSGKYGTSNSNYYLYHGTGYLWSLSPYDHNVAAFVFTVYSYGSLYGINAIHISGAVAPVINLSAEYANTLVGTGSITDPYRAA